MTLHLNQKKSSDKWYVDYNEVSPIRFMLRCGMICCFNRVLLEASTSMRNEALSAATRLVTITNVREDDSMHGFDGVPAAPTLTVAHSFASPWRPLGIQQVLKVVFDTVLGIMMLVALMPVLVVVGIAIKLDSPGPVFFRQTRIGLNNQPFRIFKFRSMHAHLADQRAAKQTVRNDVRVTRVGRVLRRSSLDELPQLLNVVRGEMSLVGPRPHAPDTSVDGVLLEQLENDYLLRHSMRPGITGLAQVNGCRGALDDLQHLRKRVELDLYYIDKWSLTLDLWILLLTPVRGLFGSRAY